MRSLALSLTLLAGCGAAVATDFQGEAAVRLSGAELARGERLLEDFDCTACHAAGPKLAERLEPKRAPNLARVGARVDPEWLRAFLLDPHGVVPGTTMPDLLARFGAGTRAKWADALVHYLASLGGPLPTEPATAGLRTVEAGRRLYHSIGCVACHDPLEPAWSLADPLHGLSADELAEAELEAEAIGGAGPGGSLAHVPDKTSLAELARFLLAPHEARPSGRMPAMHLTRTEASAIAAYLLRGRAVNGLAPDATAPGLDWSYYEAESFDTTVPDLAGMDPVRRGWTADLASIPAHRDDKFVFRFDGLLSVERAGEYGFFLASDDGSRLLLDGEPAVLHDGLHGQYEVEGRMHLEPGLHAFELTWFEWTGDEGLELAWEGPGIAKGPIPAERLRRLGVQLPGGSPFQVQDSKARKGARLFDAFRCGSCHAVEAGAGPDRARPKGAPLATLEPRAPGGCIAEMPSGRAARLDMTAEDRELLARVLEGHVTTGDGWRPRSGAEEVEHTLGAMGCTACHERGGAGGAAPERIEFFTMADGAEMGDEGRFPPPLDHVGAKLRAPWLEEVLREGTGVREYMVTRMPKFASDDVAALGPLLAALDLPGGDGPEPLPSPESIATGRELVGTGALGCIQCHTFAGHDSLGIQSVDLADVHERIRPDWFRTLLLDPKSIGMNTRMPEYFSNGRSPATSILGGDPRAQVDAMWTFLSLGHGMQLPAGLAIDGAEYEVVPADVPELVGVFMDGVSPRTIAVGDPSGVHYAFDVEGSRLAKIWRGRFFNARGTWHARAGALERPPVDPRSVIELPRGAPLARLPERDAPWPRAGEEPEGARALGYRYDAARRPIFRYAIGALEVEEAVVPETLGDGSARLVRRFVLTAPARPEGLTLRLAAGDVEPSGAAWRAGMATVAVRGDVEATWLAGSGSRRELRAAPGPGGLVEGGWRCELEVEWTW